MEAHGLFTIKLDSGKEISVSVSGSVLNDGIGAYEFWGHKFYDKGRSYVDIYSWKYDKSELVKDEIEEAESIISSNLEEWGASINKDYEDV